MESSPRGDAIKDVGMTEAEYYINLADKATAGFEPMDQGVIFFLSFFYCVKCKNFQF